MRLFVSKEASETLYCIAQRNADLRIKVAKLEYELTMAKVKLNIFTRKATKNIVHDMLNLDVDELLDRELENDELEDEGINEDFNTKKWLEENKLIDPFNEQKSEETI